MEIYRNALGQLCTLLRLVREEPEWAAVRIQELEKKLKETLLDRAAPVFIKLPLGKQATGERWRLEVWQHPRGAQPISLKPWLRRFEKSWMLLTRIMD
ncbi:MAG: hypothetical protein WC551_09005 [Patescibacteria group bacterium]